MLQGPFPLQTTELRARVHNSHFLPHCDAWKGRFGHAAVSLSCLACWTLVEKPHKRANHCKNSGNIEESSVHNVLSGNLDIPIPVSLTVIKHWPKATWKEKSWPGLQITVRCGGKPRQELTAGTEAETTEELCSWVCVPGSLSHLFSSAQAHCPGIAPSTVGWDLPYQLAVKKVLHRHAHK